MTLFAGLMYVSEEEERVEIVELGAFVVIAFVNIYFFLFWTYLMTFRFYKYEIVKKISLILKCLLKRNEEVDSILIELVEKKTEQNYKKRINPSKVFY